MAQIPDPGRPSFTYVWALPGPKSSRELTDATRAAIEAAAFARKIYREPDMAFVWLQKDKGEAQKKAFKSGSIQGWSQRTNSGAPGTTCSSPRLRISTVNETFKGGGKGRSKDWGL